MVDYSEKAYWKITYTAKVKAS